MALKDILDPADFGGRGAAEGQIAASQMSADTLRRFFDASQQNLQPFLDLSNAQLPGLEASATTEGFFGVGDQLRPAVDEFGAPIVQDKLRQLNSQLGSSGLTRSGFAGKSASNVQEDTDLALLLQLQSLFSGRSKAVAGQGAQAGTALSRLGQTSAENIGSTLSSGVLGAQQSRAAGTQNLMGLAALGTDFFAGDK